MRGTDGAGGRLGVANAQQHSGRPANAFGATAVGTARARLRAARIGLWIIAAVLAVPMLMVLSVSLGQAFGEEKPELPD